MNYDTIISWVVEATFAWLFVALNGKIQLTKSEKRPFFYKFSLWLSMITSFVGFVLSVYDHRLAVVFSPYVLVTCALVYTSVDFYYLSSKSKENSPGWLDIKSKVYSSLFQTMGLVALIFLGLGFRNDFIHEKNNVVIESKIDSLDTKFEKKSEEAKQDRQDLRKEFIQSDAKKDKAIKNVADKLAKQDAQKQKQLNTLNKDTKIIKKDTKEIKEKVDATAKPDEPAPQKKRFWFF